MLTGFKKFESKVSMLKFSMKTGSLFEPELFPAVIYRFKDNQKHVALVFSTGSVTMVGPKTVEVMNSRFQELGNVL